MLLTNKEVAMGMIANFFLEGGSFMYLILALLPILAVFGILHIVSPKKWFSIPLVCLILLLSVLGGTGTVLGISNTNAAVRCCVSDEKEALRKIGYHESSRPLIFGSGCAVVGLMALMIGNRRRKKMG